jgi:hypothetical protein
MVLRKSKIIPILRTNYTDDAKRYSKLYSSKQSFIF